MSNSFKLNTRLRGILNVSCIAICLLMISSCVSINKEENSFVEVALSDCCSKAEWTLNQIGNQGYGFSPRNIAPRDSVWKTLPICKEQWTQGFWPGVLWYCYEASGKELFKNEAKGYSEAFEWLSNAPAYDHDLGFIMYCSWGNGYRLLGDKHYKDVIVNASDRLIELYNPKVGTILSWPREIENLGGHNTIMDNLINLEMLFWASEVTGDRKYYDVAVSHADITMKYNFREDGTSYHVAVYDEITGEHIKSCTHQGYSDDSMWSRGHAWGIYGYTMCYRFTRDQKYLDFAKKITDVYLERLPSDMVPYWDFQDPEIPNVSKDASAAAVVASALIELSGYVSQKESERYYNAALAMLRSLYDNYKSENCPSFLVHSTGHRPAGSEIDYSIIYADYYYIEALLRLKKVINPSEEINLKSPDGNFDFSFIASSDENNISKLNYTVKFNEKEIIKSSELGINIENQLFESALGIANDTIPDFHHGLRLYDIERSSHSSAWAPVYGERSIIEDNYNELILKFRKSDGNHSETGDYNKNHFYYMNIVVRAYDQGIAFAYEFPEASNGLFLHITSEKTTFTLPEGTISFYERWAQGPFEKRELKGWKDESERPLTMILPDSTHVCLCEAAMINYARGKFKLIEDNKLGMSIYSSVDAITYFRTPWRVIMAGENAVDLINNNDIILNLNKECEIEDPSWIRPGKVFRCDLNMDAAKKGVDFAASMKLDYIHLDSGWYGKESKNSSDATRVAKERDLNIPEICKYAKSKGIGVFVYVNQRALFNQLNEMLPLYKKWGLSGIKFGFVQIGNQQWSTWLHDAVKKCAEYELMVDIHDEYRPTGFSRTYPNLLTQEGIRGNEEMPDATHNVILPYTRFIAGPGDYTPCYFSNRVKNTRAHQLAMPAVYYSPLQFLFWYDKPHFYRGEQELEFWKEIPTIWDDSNAVDGEVGEYIIQARKSGEKWFVGALTNTEGRNITIETSKFLNDSLSYSVKIYEDYRGNDEDLKKSKFVTITEKEIHGGDKIELSLLPSGGAALTFTPRK